MNPEAVIKVCNDIISILAGTGAPPRKLYDIGRRLDEAEKELSRSDLFQRRSK